MRAILITVLFVCGCEQADNSSFIGNWNYCGYAGQYDEIHIANKDLVNIWMNTSDWYLPKKYQLHNDTLLYYDTLFNWRDENGNLGIILNQFVIENDNLVWLVSHGDTISRRVSYSKMPFDLEEYQNNDTLTYAWRYEQFEQRIKFNCPDLRSVEEKLRDSIETKRMLIELGKIL